MPPPTICTVRTRGNFGRSRAVPPKNRPVPQKVYRRPVTRRQEPAERSRHICGTSLESSMLSGLAQSDKSSRKYSPSLFLPPITPVTRVPLLTYRADLTHRFPRGPFFRLPLENGAACRFNDRSASSSSLRNRSFSACAFSSCRRRVSTCRVSSSTLADSLDSLPLIQFKVTKLAGFVHCLVKISRFHNALNPVNKYKCSSLCDVQYTA